MNKNVLDGIEKSGFIRAVVLISAIIGIPSGILAFIRADTAIGGLFCIGTVIILAVAGYALFSITNSANKEIERIRKEARIFQDNSKNYEGTTTKIPKTDSPKPTKVNLSPTKIGFIVGFIYGFVIFIALLLFLYSGNGSAVAGIFFGIVIACYTGIMGIVPAHIGWHWHNLNQAKTTGAVVAGLLGLIGISIILGDIGSGLWLGIFTAPAGWLSAKSAYSYRHSRDKTEEDETKDK